MKRRTFGPAVFRVLQLALGAALATAFLALPAQADPATRDVTSGVSAATMDESQCLATAASPATIRNAVLDWNERAQKAIVPNVTPLPRPPGSSIVLEGIVQAAIYDATVAVEGGYELFVASPHVNRPASTAAAVATAPARSWSLACQIRRQAS